MSRDTGVWPAPVSAAVVAGTAVWKSSDDPILAAGALGWTAFMLLIFGTAIARSTATGFCLQTRTGAVASLRFSIVSLRQSLLSTLLAVLLVSIPLGLTAFASWMAQAGRAGSWLVMVGWPLVYLLAVLSVLTGVVVGIAWLLSLGAIGTDQCAGSDALSRGINYVLSHKLKTAWYLVVVLLLSKLSFFLSHCILLAADNVLAGHFAGLMPRSKPSMVPPVEADGFAGTMLYLWHLSIGLLPAAVEIGVFLTGTTLLYILLRQAEDAVQLREMDGGSAGRPRP